MDREINFKPLTDGLGFHPFADGLPYAPANKKPTSTTGTGAVSAGRPQFSYPVTSAVRSTPVDVTAEKIRRELEAIQTQRNDQARVMAARVQKPIEVTYGYSYSFERIFAYLLDSAFNLSICASILSVALISTDLNSIQEISSAAMITVGVFLFICNWALLAAQEVAFGTTIGKRIFGLKLDGTGVQCLIRSLLFLPALLSCGLGILTAVFDSRKRCWHDRMTQIQPS